MKRGSQRIILGLFCAIVALVSYSAGNAEFKVYDANNQFLGILMGAPGSEMTLFVPSLQKALILTTKQVSNSIYYETPRPINQVIFETNDCTGTPYVPPVYISEIVKSAFLNGFHYIDTGNPRTITPGSQVIYDPLNPAGGAVCGTVNNANSTLALPLIPLEATLPFTFPLATPLKYTYLPIEDKLGLKHALYILQLTSNHRDSETSTVISTTSSVATTTTTTTIPPTTSTTSTTTIVIRPSTTTTTMATTIPPPSSSSSTSSFATTTSPK